MIANFTTREKIGLIGARTMIKKWYGITTSIKTGRVDVDVCVFIVRRFTAVYDGHHSKSLK